MTNTQETVNCTLKSAWVFLAGIAIPFATAWFIFNNIKFIISKNILPPEQYHLYQILMPTLATFICLAYILATTPWRLSASSARLSLKFWNRTEEYSWAQLAVPSLDGPYRGSLVLVQIDRRDGGPPIVLSAHMYGFNAAVLWGKLYHISLSASQPGMAAIGTPYYSTV